MLEKILNKIFDNIKTINVLGDFANFAIAKFDV